MPTPTIDPMAYEAAYEAVKQYDIDQTIIFVIFLAVVCFVYWMFKE